MRSLHNQVWSGKEVKQVFILAHAEARRRALEAVQNAPDGMGVTIAPPSRTLEQNAAMWPILECFSAQLDWPVNGRMGKMSKESWKDVLTAAFRKEEVQLAMGLDGGVVMLGHKTREFRKQEFIDWLNFLHFVAADRGVNLEYLEK